MTPRGPQSSFCLRRFLRIEGSYQSHLFPYVVAFVTVSFFAYSISCFFSNHMKREFVRYGFGGQRRLIGATQLLAVLALSLGFQFPWLGALGAGGLAVQMLVAVGVRVRIRDGVLKTIPALLFFALNAWLFLWFLELSAE